MERKPLTSSTLLSAGYDSGRHILELQFVSGDVYRYFEVPGKVFEELLEAISHGQYFNYSIKDRYRFKKIS